MHCTLKMGTVMMKLVRMANLVKYVHVASMCPVEGMDEASIHRLPITVGNIVSVMV